jgi:Domain of unknown function (DUF1707)
MATGPDLRIGDAEREAAAAHLREHYAQGRLSLDEFNQRLDAVFGARTQQQLHALTADLPRSAAAAAPLPVTAAAGAGGRERARQDSGPGPRARLGFVSLVIAALATWLLILELPLRTFPWPGRLAIFLAVLGVLRGLLRRVFGIGRGGVRARGHKCGGPRRRGRYTGGSWDI